jgi:hypothetical protein
LIRLQTLVPALVRVVAERPIDFAGGLAEQKLLVRVRITRCDLLESGVDRVERAAQAVDWKIAGEHRPIGPEHGDDLLDYVGHVPSKYWTISPRTQAWTHLTFSRTVRSYPERSFAVRPPMAVRISRFIRVHPSSTASIGSSMAGVQGDRAAAFSVVRRERAAY